MFTPSEIGINPTMCNTGQQGLNRLAQSVLNIFNQISQGVGGILRFRLSSPLTIGGSAAAQILRFDGSFTPQTGGVVHDEEIAPGYWSGAVGDEGWCTARDGQSGHYSIIFMPLVLQQMIDDASSSSDTSVFPSQPPASTPTPQPTGAYGIPVENVTAEVIPPFSVMRPSRKTTISGEKGYEVSKPSNATETFWLVNGPNPIAISGTGYAALLDLANWVAYDSGSGDPEDSILNNLSNNTGSTAQIQILWGAVNNSWLLAPTTGRGFMTLGNKTTVNNPSGGTVSVCRAIQIFDVHAYMTGFCVTAAFSVGDWLHLIPATASVHAPFTNTYSTAASYFLNVDIAGVYKFHASGLVRLGGVATAPTLYDQGKIRFRLYRVLAGGDLTTAVGTDVYGYTEHWIFIDNNGNLILTPATMVIDTHINLAKGEGVAVKVEYDDIATTHDISMGDSGTTGANCSLYRIAGPHIANHGF